MIHVEVVPEIEFAVDMLVADGLRAGPFAGHHDGHGQLRRAGLTAWLWTTWLQDLATSHDLRQTGKGTGKLVSADLALPARVVAMLQAEWLRWRPATDLRRDMERALVANGAELMAVAAEGPSSGSQLALVVKYVQPLVHTFATHKVLVAVPSGSGTAVWLSLLESAFRRLAVE